jgi:hypothetical protein
MQDLRVSACHLETLLLERCNLQRKALKGPNPLDLLLGPTYSKKNSTISLINTENKLVDSESPCLRPIVLQTIFEIPFTKSVTLFLVTHTWIANA